MIDWQLKRWNMIWKRALRELCKIDIARYYKKACKEFHLWGHLSVKQYIHRIKWDNKKREMSLANHWLPQKSNLNNALDIINGKNISIFTPKCQSCLSKRRNYSNNPRWNSTTIFSMSKNILLLVKKPVMVSCGTFFLSSLGSKYTQNHDFSDLQ